MDFFARQDQSRRTTRALVVLFGLAFLSVALATATVIAVLFRFMPNLREPLLSTTIGSGNADLIGPFLITAGIVLVLMLIASAGRSAMLASGGASVARMLGGTEIRQDSADPLHRRLVNVVEEMSIAAGVPVPDVFVLESEAGINAFAAGLEQGNAAVAVTRGALERLSRAELQGVIAHEFSHILNGDMRINQRLLGLSFGILVLSLVGRWVLHSARFAGRSRGGKASVAVLLGLALTIIGFVGVFFGRLIKAAVSRQREMLADASAVQFTRDPTGLAGALKKIGGYSTEFTATEAEEVAHMLFGRGSSAFRGWFATHPPLPERIRALDPTFTEADFVRQPDRGEPSPVAPEEAGAAFAASASLTPRGDFSLDDAGRIESADVGRALHAAIPADLRESAHAHEAGWLLVVALACSDEPADHDRQRLFLEQRLGAQRAAVCLRLRREVAALDVGLRLPLLELCMPALRQRPDEQLDFLLDLVNELIEQRAVYSLSGFVLPHVLTAWLGRRPGRAARRSRVRMRAGEALRTLIAAVASFGHEDGDRAASAYLAGMAAVTTRRDVAAPPITAHDPVLLRSLDSALDMLRNQSAKIKRGALAAVLATIRHDREIRIEEMELFRAIAATLDVPAPPLVVGMLEQRA